MDYIKIPIQLIDKVLKEKRLNSFKTFCYLKLKFRDGKIINYKKELIKIASDLDCSERTIKNHFKELQNLKYIQIHINCLFIRSFREIYRMNKFRSTITVNFNNKHLNNFSIFCFCAALGAWINYIKKKRPIKEVVHTKGIETSTFRDSEDWPFLSTEFISNNYKMSIGNVSKYKKAGHKLNFLRIHKNYRKLFLKGDPNLLHNQKNKNIFNELYPHLAGRLKIYKNELFLRQSDKFEPLLKYSSLKLWNNNESKNRNRKN